MNLDQIIPKTLGKDAKAITIDIPNRDSIFQYLEENLKYKDIENDSFAFGKFIKFNLNLNTINSICINGECTKEVEIEIPG